MAARTSSKKKTEKVDAVSPEQDELKKLREQLAAEQAKTAEFENREKQRELAATARSSAPAPGFTRILNVRENENSRSTLFPIKAFFDLLVAIGSDGSGLHLKECQSCLAVKADKRYVNLPSRGQGGGGYAGNLMGSDVVERVQTRNSSIAISRNGMVIANVVSEMIKNGEAFRDVDIDHEISQIDWDLISTRTADGDDVQASEDRADALQKRAQSRASKAD